MPSAAVAPPTEWFDLQYAAEPAINYVLLIERDGNSLKVAWYHRFKNLFTGVAHYAVPDDGIEALISAKPFLKAAVHQTLIGITNPNFRLVPTALAQREPFTATNEFDADAEVVLSNSLVGLPAVLEYAANKRDAEWTRLFRNAVVVPSAMPMVERMMSAENSTTGDAVVAELHQTHVFLYATRNGKLLLANSFYQSCVEDVAYYLLYSAEVLGISPESASLYLCGSRVIESGLWTYLKPFWKRIASLPAFSSANYARGMVGYPEAEFAQLTHLLRCA